MAANPPESRIPPTAAGWFWRCRLALGVNMLKIPHRERRSKLRNSKDLGTYLLELLKGTVSRDFLIYFFVLITKSETVTEPWMTKPRKTEPRKTERQKTEPRMTEPQMTEPRIGPNLKWPKLESDRTSNDQILKRTNLELDRTSKRTESRMGLNLVWLNLEWDWTSKME